MFTLETLQEKFNTLYNITGLEYIDQVEEQVTEIKWDLTSNFEIRPFLSPSGVYKVEKRLAAAKTSSKRP